MDESLHEKVMTCIMQGAYCNAILARFFKGQFELMEGIAEKLKNGSDLTFYEKQDMERIFSIIDKLLELIEIMKTRPLD